MIAEDVGQEGAGGISEIRYKEGDTAWQCHKKDLYSNKSELSFRDICQVFVTF